MNVDPCDFLINFRCWYLFIVRMEDDGIEASLEWVREELLKGCTLSIGMEFESEDATYRLYSEYGRIVGFTVRKDYSIKNKKDDVTTNTKFVYSKEGVKEKNSRTHAIKLPRRETITNCKAFM